MKSIQTRPLNLSESKDLCKTIASMVNEGDVFALTGELGAGKTTFVSNIARHMGMKSGYDVSSPTYVIHHVYEAKFLIHHIDLYRLEHPAQVENFGFEEFLGNDGVAFIEWFEKFPQIWTGQHIEVRFQILDMEHRRYTFAIQNGDLDRWETLFIEIQKKFS